MKINDYITICMLMLFLGCSKNDDDGGTQSETIESYQPVAIEFVREDGSSISSTDCITPDETYAIQVTTTENSKGNTTVSKIEYTINGAVFSMSFTEAGAKRNPITFVAGKNIAEIVKTANSTELSFISQDDFELVE